MTDWPILKKLLLYVLMALIAMLAGHCGGHLMQLCWGLMRRG